MEFSAVKTWQWMLIALAMGLVVGMLRNRDQNEIHGNYVEGFGYFLGDQKRFEDALTTRIDGSPRLRDITVHARRIQHGQEAARWVYLVAGTYYFGRPQTVEGRAQGGWQPICFIAPDPYEPLLDFSTLQAPGSPDWSKTFRAAGLRPTVLDFLIVMHSAADVSFRYSWWDTYPIVNSIVVSFALIGILLPLAINLVAFGRVVRPPRARALSLWKVRNRATSITHAETPSSATAEDVPSSSPANIEPTALSSIKPAASAKPLASDTDAEHVALPPSAPREFGARDEDFYPTERHHPPG